MIKSISKEQEKRAEELSKAKLDNQEGIKNMMGSIKNHEMEENRILSEKLVEYKKALLDRSNEIIMARAHILTDLIGKVDKNSKEFSIILSDIMRTLKIEK